MEFELLSIDYSRVCGIAGVRVFNFGFCDGERGRSLFQVYNVEGEWFIDLLFFHIK